MKYKKTIVCLANSRKTSGRCIAGKEIKEIEDLKKVGGWIRPVSARQTREISEEERRYEDGSDPVLLDILCIPFEQEAPQTYHPEDQKIDPGERWVSKGKWSLRKLEDLLDSPDALWSFNQSSSTSGLNNRVHRSSASGDSLYLVRVDNLVVFVGKKAQQYPDSRRAVRGEFTYNSIRYRLDVTDPEIERFYLGRQDGQHSIGTSIITVSRGEPHSDDYCYKLIAAIFKE